MFIGIDIGGSNMGAGLFDEDLNIIARAKVKSKAKEDTSVVLGQLFKVIRKFEKYTDLSNVKAIGVGVAALVNPKTGDIKYCANININDINLADAVQKEFNIPTFIENDVNVGTIGEWKYGCGKGHNNLIGIFVGTGIGGGLVLNGQLYQGVGGMAAEIGHTTINDSGAYCSGCGASGCVEAYSSKTGIEQKIKALDKKGIESPLIDMVKENNGKLKSSHLVTSLEMKDVIAEDVINHAMEKLGVAIGNYLNVLNPSLVVLGGGVMESLGELLLPKIKISTSEFAMKPIFDNCEFKLAELGDDAGLYGAMDVAVEGLKASIV